MGYDLQSGAGLRGTKPGSRKSMHMLRAACKLSCTGRLMEALLVHGMSRVPGDVPPVLCCDGFSVPEGRVVSGKAEIGERSAF